MTDILKDVRAALELGQKATGGEWIVNDCTRRHTGRYRFRITNDESTDADEIAEVPVKLLLGNEGIIPGGKDTAENDAAFIAAMCSNRGEMVRKLLERCEEAEKDAARWQKIELLWRLGKVELDVNDGGFYVLDIDPAEFLACRKYGTDPNDAVDQIPNDAICPDDGDRASIDSAIAASKEKKG